MPARPDAGSRRTPDSPPAAFPKRRRPILASVARTWSGPAFLLLAACTSPGPAPRPASRPAAPRPAPVRQAAPVRPTAPVRPATPVRSATPNAAVPTWRDCPAPETLLKDSSGTLQNARLGFMCEQYAIGYAFENGLGVKRDDAEAADWYKQASLQGDAAAQMRLARLYIEGRGVARSPTDAEQLFRSAEKNGEPQATLELGHLYADRHTELHNDRRALEEFQRAAAAGNALAQFEVGMMNQLGLGTPPDAAMARTWYEKSAAQNEGRAHAALGTLYEHGLLGPKDMARANQEYRLAADLRVPLAEAKVGHMYRTGIGVGKDPAMALAWLSEAAAADDSGAQGELADLYAHGEGIPRDDFLAYYWQRLHVGGLDDKNGPERLALDAMEHKLQPGQIDQAVDKLAFFVRSGTFAGATPTSAFTKFGRTEQVALLERWRGRNEAYLEQNWRRPKVVGSPFEMQSETLRAGTGATPQAGGTVTIRYTLTLIDGDLVDTSLTHGGTVTFGLDHVVAGLTQGLLQMKTGGHSKFYVPAALGYADRGAGIRVPPYSTLIFDVELVSAAAR